MLLKNLIFRIQETRPKQKNCQSFNGLDERVYNRGSSEHGRLKTAYSYLLFANLGHISPVYVRAGHVCVLQSVLLRIMLSAADSGYYIEIVRKTLTRIIYVVVFFFSDRRYCVANISRALSTIGTLGNKIRKTTLRVSFKGCIIVSNIRFIPEFLAVDRYCR